MRTRSLILMALMGALTLLAGCGGGGAEPFRAFINRTHFSDKEVWGAYRFAAANPQALKFIPCYCGCQYQGHGSNWNCYIEGEGADGTPIFTPHAAG